MGLDILRQAAGNCTDCGLAAGRKTVVFGEGDPKATLMLVGEAPGQDEDTQGRPFVGKSGSLVNKWLGEAGIERSSVFIHNVVMCRPPGNRTPTDEEMKACSSHFWAKTAAVSPRVVVTLGKTAATAVLGDSVSRLPMGQIRNGYYYDPQARRLIVPTYHPSYVLRGNADAEQRIREDLEKALRQLIRLNLYKGVPKAEWAAQVLIDTVEELYGSEE